MCLINSRISTSVSNCHVFLCWEQGPGSQSSCRPLLGSAVGSCMKSTENFPRLMHTPQRWALPRETSQSTSRSWGELLWNQNKSSSIFHSERQHYGCVGVHDGKISLGLQRCAFCHDYFLGHKDSSRIAEVPCSTLSSTNSSSGLGACWRFPSLSSVWVVTPAAEQAHHWLQKQRVVPLHTPELTCMD